MIILPAIDLLDGKCVRLYKGDYGKSQKVAEDAVETAKKFKDLGAEYLHVVDLNAARDGGGQNLNIIEKLTNLGLKVQTGGGIRDMESLKTRFSIGIFRAIIGSAAVTDRAFLLSALEKYKDKIAVGIDADGGLVKIKGWLIDSGINYLDLAKELSAAGAETFIYTDISRDGTLTGADIEGTLELKNAVNRNIIASGGVNSYGDIEKLKAADIYGVILGKSIYSGTVSLNEAIRMTKGE